jgi:hypothetical protein
MIEIMIFAMTEMRQTVEPKTMEVYVDGSPCFTGSETDFTNPAIEAGIMNCRVMLEFLGICLKGGASSELDVRRSHGRIDDLRIEDFEKDGIALKKVTPDMVRYLAPIDPEKGVRAIARLLHISNKEIAHSTIGRNGEDDGTDVELLTIGAKSVRALTVRYFFSPLGLPAPNKLIRHA